MCGVQRLPSFLEVASISPCREFRSKRRADSYEIRSLADLREPDLIGRRADDRPAKKSLAFFDRFPSFFDGSEVPSAAFRTDCPKASFRFVECELSAYRKMFDRLVLTERRMTEDAGRIRRLEAEVRPDPRFHFLRRPEGHPDEIHLDVFDAGERFDLVFGVHHDFRSRWATR